MEVFFIRAGALGDAVLTLPAIQAFRRERPGWKISVIGSYPLLSLLKGSPFADDLFPIDDASFSSFFSQGELSSAWVERFRRAEFIFVFLEDSLLFKNLKRAGTRKAVIPGGTGKDGHVTDKFMSALSHAGIRGAKAVPEIFIPEEEKKFAEDFLESRGLLQRKLAAVHPGSGSKKKNWPAEKFEAVTRKLIGDYGMDVIVPCGEADADEVLRLSSHFESGGIFTAGDLEIRRLAAVLSKCRLYVGNDSGVSHIAAACGVPSVCVFGPTDPVTWSPRGREVRIISNNAECSPCLPGRENYCADRECLLGVGVSEVLREAVKVAGEPGSIAPGAAAVPS